MPFRHLFAYLGKRVPERAALLRFPPGVTLEDTGYDWQSSVPGADMPTLPEWAVERLRRLGVEVAASPEAISEALDHARLEQYRSSLDGFAEDYLRVNARLGGERCIAVWEYAMDTEVRLPGECPLQAILVHHLFERGGVRVYGGAAFRDVEVPEVLRLRVQNIVRHELSRQHRLFVPCRLHGDGCRGYPRRIIGYSSPYATVSDALDARHRGARVAVPRSLLDDMQRRSGPARHRAAWEIMRLVLNAFPDDAWKDDAWKPPAFDAVVAAAVAETCEEYKMLVDTLWKCASCREMVRRARNTSWAVSRALEAMP